MYVFIILLRWLCSSIEDYKGVGHCFFIPGLRSPIPKFSCYPNYLKTEKWLQIIFSLGHCKKERWQTFTKLREKLL